ncbi:hypothetical protein BB561_006636 [Smittium simulii]|uniref:Uncharacterized protein n=1 Tax=Smittium simulii TaxID=133385 RepID=A0A2T9Y2R3_9FUNG|nr:hypothetical protein BB561_006636 [Smittium simulii]
MFANKPILLVFLLTQTLVWGSLANRNNKETNGSEIARREQVDSYQNSKTFDNGLGGITKCNADGCYNVPSDSAITNSNFYNNVLSKRYDSGQYEPDDSGQYIHDDSGEYIHDNSGDYIHDDSEQYEHDPDPDFDVRVAQK